MKKIIIVISALSFSINSIAQTDTTISNEKVQINIGNKKIIIKTSNDGKLIDVDMGNEKKITKIKTSSKRSYPKVELSGSIDIGVAGLTYVKNNSNNSSHISTASTELDYGKNRHYGLNLHLSYNLTKNFGVLTGLGYNCNRYTFKNSLTVDAENGNFLTDSVNSYNYFQFNNNYWQIPLMLKFQNNKQNFQFAAGGIIGYNVKSKVEYEYAKGNTEYFSKTIGNFNVNPLKLSLGARLTYKNIGVFFNYSLSNLNENSYSNSTENFDLLPFSAGITLGSF